MPTDPSEAASIPHLRDVLIFLGASVLLVPLFQRLRTSPIIGYLLVGVLIGPYGLAVIADVEGAQILGELGVVFLLFTIGLELPFERLKAMRRHVFGLGLLQIGVSGAVIGSIAFLWGNGVAASLVLGACLALSSTALVMQILMDRGELATRTGRVCLAVLLAQDLAVAPILAMTTALGRGQEGLVLHLVIALGKALLAIGVILALGRLLLRRIYRMVAEAGRPEIITATSLLLVLLTASATGLAGLSMALGAFLAGLLLSETEFRHQVEADIQPFRGLLVGLFFLSVGMGINVPQAAQFGPWIVASVAGLIALKTIILVALCTAFKVERVAAIRVALLLAGTGEFAFVVLRSAMGSDIVSAPIGQFMLIVTALGMVSTPLLAAAAPRLSRMLGREEPKTATPDPAAFAEVEGHVIIAGYGRVGRTVGKLLRGRGVPFVALDLDPRRTQALHAEGEPVFYSDATRPNVLESVGIEHAAAIVVTLDDTEAAARVAHFAQRNWPMVRTFVRARDAAHAEELARLGVNGLVLEALEASLALGAQVLEALGTPADVVDRVVDQSRREMIAAPAPGRGARAMEPEPAAPPA